MEDTPMDRMVASFQTQPLFKAAVTEFLESILPYLKSQDVDSEMHARLERLLIPERTISFKIVWEDDNGNLRTNLGYRVQFNSALGPYKGGLRFDPSVNEDVLKFLGFEQIFKNALTGLPLGGGKGGSEGYSFAKEKRFAGGHAGGDVPRGWVRDGG